MREPKPNFHERVDDLPDSSVDSDDKKLAETDQLTDLRNLRWLDNNLPQIMAEYPGNFALVFADIDNLKDINDEHGHDEGDRLITNVAHVLREMVRKDDAVVIRVAGDELIIILKGINNDDGLKVVMDRFTTTLDDLGAPTSFGGVVHTPGQTGEELKKAADVESQRAKRKRQVENTTDRQLEVIGPAVELLESEDVSLRGLGGRVAALREARKLPPSKAKK